MIPPLKDDGFDALCRHPTDRPLLLAILATLAPAGTTKDALGVLVLDDALHIFEDVDGSGILRECLKKAPSAHTGIEELEIHAQALEFAKDRVALGNSARAVEKEAVGEASCHADGVVADQLELGLVGGEVQIVFRGGGRGRIVGEARGVLGSSSGSLPWLYTKTLSDVLHYHLPNSEGRRFYAASTNSGLG